MADVEKQEEKQKPTLRTKLQGKGNSIALWTAVVTALGSQGIPKIIEIFENKPSTAAVQTMIATQTEKHALQLNNAVEVIQSQGQQLVALQGSVGALTGKLELLTDVMRDCCTRRSAVRRLTRPTTTSVKPEPKPDPAPEMMETTAVDKLKKVPAFKKEQIQQQIQIQEP